jgi:uncharacterized protein
VRITLAETVAAMTRRERGGRTSPQEAARALRAFQLDFARQYFINEVSAGLVVEAAFLARRRGLRGYDAVQLAAALEVHSKVPSLTLLSADADLSVAATGEGILSMAPIATPKPREAIPLLLPRPDRNEAPDKDSLCSVGRHRRSKPTQHACHYQTLAQRD